MFPPSLLLDEVDNGTNHKPGLGPGGTGPGNYGILVNNDGDNDGAAVAKTILDTGNAKLTNADAWQTGNWGTHKTNITGNLEQATSQNDTSKANAAIEAIDAAKNSLKTGTSETAARVAEKILNDAKNKLEGIGSHVTPYTYMHIIPIFPLHGASARGLADSFFYLPNPSLP